MEVTKIEVVKLINVLTNMYLNNHISESKFDELFEKQSKALALCEVIRQSEQLSCLDCKYNKGLSHHDRMWCRDCQQYNHHKAV